MRGPRGYVSLFCCLRFAWSNYLLLHTTTGFITNQKFDVPKVIPPEFDSSLPEEHYMLKRKEYLRQTDVQYSLRIDDLPQEIG